MKAAPIIIRVLVWMIIAILVIPMGTAAQEVASEPGETNRFNKEELAQMLAPIALYPDSLIAQMLMASTYPLEIVVAERWLRQNKELKGDALNEALKEKTWDPSIKSLCHFPDVLFAMSDKLDQTRKLGDAFLSQQDEVMETIQELRRSAQEQGNLKTTEEEKVMVEKNTIIIEPADPQVVYVPIYNPLYVYGPWWYPDYPPYYWYYPPGYVITGGFISFGPRIFIGLGLFSWAWCDWPYHRIYVDMYKTRWFNRPLAGRDLNQHFWHHNPRHRRGVAYRDSRTSELFGVRPPSVSPPSAEIRGFPSKGIERRAVKPSQGTVKSREQAVVPQLRPERGRIKTIPGHAKPSGEIGSGRIERVPRRDTPFSGVGNGSLERRAGERGGNSRTSVIRSPGSEIRTPGAGGVMREQGGGFRGGGNRGIRR
jgi:hypothetical protein